MQDREQIVSDGVSLYYEQQQEPDAACLPSLSLSDISPEFERVHLTLWPPEQQQHHHQQQQQQQQHQQQQQQQQEQLDAGSTSTPSPSPPPPPHLPPPPTATTAATTTATTATTTAAATAAAARSPVFLNAQATNGVGYVSCLLDTDTLPSELRSADSLSYAHGHI